MNASSSGFELLSGVRREGGQFIFPSLTYTLMQEAGEFVPDYAIRERRTYVSVFEQSTHTHTVQKK